MKRIRWIFFDIGSTLVDEEAACRHRVRDIRTKYCSSSLGASNPTHSVRLEEELLETLTPVRMVKPMLSGPSSPRGDHSSPASSMSPCWTM